MSKKEETFNKLMQTMMNATGEERQKGNIEVSYNPTCEEMTARSKRSALSVSTIVGGCITFDDEVTEKRMRIYRKLTKSPTITAAFLDDGDLYEMELSFIVHNQIGHETVFHCNIYYRSAIFVPHVSLDITELEQQKGRYISKRKNFIRYSNRLSAIVREFNAMEDGHEAWTDSEINALEEKLNEWKEQLLLEYQTSDAKALAAVLTFLSKIHKHLKKEDDDTYAKDAFSRMIIACLEALGKYENEVANSVAGDLGLKNADAIKHVLSYLRRK